MKNEGIIEKMQARQKTDGTPYIQLIIDGERYAVFDAEPLEYVSVGDPVSFTYNQKGYSKTIQHLRKSVHSSDDFMQEV